MYRRAKRYGILAGLVGSAAMAVAWASLLEACGKAGGAFVDGGEAEASAEGAFAEAALEDSGLAEVSDASSTGDGAADGRDGAVKKDASVRTGATARPKHDRNLYRLPAE